VNGNGFVASSVVRWNGTDRPTTFISSTHIEAAISGSDILASGTTQIRVYNAPPGGGISAAAELIISPPTPSITSISPAAATAGSAAITLIINGTSLLTNSIVRWDTASELNSTFISSTELRALIPAVFLGGGAAHQISIANPPGAISNSATFTVNNLVPGLTSTSPSSLMAGTSGVLLKLFGINFTTNSVALWNEVARSTLFISPTEVWVAILAGDLAIEGTAQIRVRNPAPGGGVSNTLTVPITPHLNPVPSLTRIFPVNAAVGGPGFVLSMYGSGFLPGAVVRWNGASRSTTVYGDGYAVATILAEDIASLGTVPVTISNPSPGGGLSNSLPFAVTSTLNPIPTIQHIAPSMIIVGGNSGQVSIHGTGFVANSVARLNGSDRSTVFISDTLVAMDLLQSDMAMWGANLRVAIFNPNPGGGLSNTVALTIGARSPSIDSLSPRTAYASRESFTLTVRGSDFVPTSTVMWDSVHGGGKLDTTFISDRELRAKVPDSLVERACTAQVWVTTPPPGGGDSITIPLWIYNPAPKVSYVFPNRAPAGGLAFRMHIQGSDFVHESVVRWNGSDLSTTFISPTELDAIVPEGLHLAPSTAAITVFNPPTNQFVIDGGISNEVSFEVTASNPVPSISSLTPSYASAGDPGVSLVVSGTGFLSDSTVLWDNAPRNTIMINNAQVRAEILASDLAQPGPVVVAILNPPPGGGVSNELTFTVTSESSGPTIFPDGVVNAASYALASTAAVSPGSIAAIFGSNLSDCLPLGCNSSFDANGRLVTKLGATQVLINDTAAPMFYASPNQLVVQVPADLQGDSATVKIVVGEKSSPVEVTTVSPVSPGIFTVAADGRGAAAITHVDGSLCTAANAARPGEMLVLYATGLGIVVPSVPTGVRPAGISTVANSTTVFIDNIPVVPDFAGLSPCCVGLNQVNFRVPEAVQPGDSVPVVIGIGNVLSNPVTLAVQAK
jgi:uncharacterized protein (TIGR03437 family)